MKSKCDKAGSFSLHRECVVAVTCLLASSCAAAASPSCPEARENAAAAESCARAEEPETVPADQAALAPSPIRVIRQTVSPLTADQGGGVKMVRD
jgi:hypothetical protein